jgi:superfamily II DNA helicase RecQ
MFDQKTIESLKISDLTSETGSRDSKSRSKKSAKRPAASAKSLSTDDQILYQALKNWRLEESRKSRTPAFRILGDRSLHEIAQTKPGDETSLLNVSGVGPAKFKKYGKKILSLLSSI